MPHAGLSVLRFHIRMSLVVVGFVIPGCAPAPITSDSPKDRPQPAVEAALPDIWQRTIADAETAEEKKSIQASRPILEAIVGRNYEALFELVSPHALKRVFPMQFGPTLDAQGNEVTLQPVLNMTREHFMEAMKYMEGQLGTPTRVMHLYVQTTDPQELGGKADAIDNMFNLGAIPAEVPVEIRRASLRAQLGCRIPEKDIARAAAEIGVSEDDIRSGKAFEGKGEQFESGEGPYMNLKLVLVEENGRIQIGYFEFLPPSMLD